MGERAFDDGVRFLKSAEDLHVNDNPAAMNWYLRAIAHLLVAIAWRLQHAEKQP